jgi:5-methylcytosine-specific restriction endonuclease McrA
MGVRPHRKVYSTRRWQVVRLEALRRDGFRCRECNDWRHLEVHHVKRLEDHPELAFDLANLLTLCRTCHTDETNRQLGNRPDPERRAWRDAVAELAAKPSSNGETKCLTA